MKRHLSTLCLAIFVSAPAPTVGAAVAIPQSVVVERGLDHRVHERVIEQQVAPGKTIQRKSRVTELATGMHRLVDGQYVECRNTIELLNGYAVARQTRLPVIFAASPNAAAAIDSEAPDGKRFRCNVLGLALFDSSNGNSLMINEVQEVVGEMHPPNRVYYPAALAGTSPEFPACDLFYTVELAGWEQFVLIRNKFSLPPGFNPETTRLECWTEFLTPPTPLKQLRTIHGTPDENLDFGAVSIGPGKAFMLGENGWSTSVAKSWVQTEGRFFLIEAVPWKLLRSRIGELPAAPGQAAVRQNKAVGLAQARQPFPGRVGLQLPAPRADTRPNKAMRMASAPMPTHGLVLDAAPVLSSVSLTLEGDKTYLCSSAVLCTNLTIEGGVVVKYTNNAYIEISGLGTVTCLTSPYRPAVFTSVFDSNVGEIISTNQSPGRQAAAVLITHGGNLPDLSHFRISYAVKGLSIDDHSLTIKNSMFTHCDHAFYFDYGSAGVRNCLFYGNSNAFGGYSFAVQGEHITFNAVTNISGSTTEETSINFTNCIIATPFNWGQGDLYTNAVATGAASNLFQTVGSSLHYLATNSPYRNAGVSTTAIAQEIRTKTTYPPTVYPSLTYVTNQNLTLTNQAQRDTDTPDLGWHPEVMDYVFAAVLITNCTLTVSPGTVLGFYTDPTYQWGLGVGGGGRLIAEGSHTNLARFVRYNTVQEIANTNWVGSVSPLILLPWFDAVPRPEIRFRFADFAVLEKDAYLVYGYDTFLANMPPVSFVDCQFRGGMIFSQGPSLVFTNSLFERVDQLLYPLGAWPLTNRYQNNLFFGGTMSAYPYASTNEMTFRDNVFDQTILSGSTDVANSHNGYSTNSTNFSRLTPSGTNDVLVSAFTWNTGRFGRWYQPTNSPLINTGSVNNAATAGLYWYATTTNHQIEANSWLDIGYHYVGLNPSTGEPWDTNEDGVPNYLQDLSGNGITEPNELSGLKLWLKADVGVTTNNSGVTTWADQSGNNNSATQNTSGTYPLLIPGALNGKPIVRFDGTNDVLIMPNFAQAFSAGEILAVLKADAALPTAHRGLWRFGLEKGRYPDTNGLITEAFGFAATARVLGTPSFSITNHHTYNVCSAPGEWSARLNGLLYLQTTNVVSFANATPALGRSSSSDEEFFKGDIAEVLMYNRALPSLDRDELSAYLNQRYALVASPTTNSGVRATAISSNQVSVSWTNALVTTSVRTVVERRKSSGAYSVIASVRDASSYFDSGLLAGTTYSYRLKNANPAGESPYSIEVSTTTSNATIQLPLTSLRTWLKSDAGIASSKLSFWEDQSGYANHASQSDLFRQPDAVPFAQRAKPIVRFNGTSHLLAFPNFANVTNQFSEAEALIVVRATVEMPSTDQRLWKFGDNDGTYPDISGVIIEGFGRQGAAVKSSYSGMTLNVFNVYQVSSKSNEFMARWNDLIVLETNTNTFKFQLPVYLGAVGLSGGWFSGDIAEFQIYNRVLTASERATAYFYLKDKYGLLDSDGDGLPDADEISRGTDPNKADTNGDGLSDWEDIQVGISPTNDDIDGDGLSNAVEILIGTSPFDPNTDRDPRNDKEDFFPLDPTRWDLPTQTNDVTAPVILLLEPTNATPL